MNLKKAVILFGFVIVIMVTTQIIFAEEAAVAPIDQAVITSNQEPALGKESDMQWAWGEVTNLDNQAKAITLKYLDYETDQEKELVLVVDEKTTFENIEDFDGLKLKDTLSIDYMSGVENKNIAKNVSFENPDASSPAPVPVQSETAVVDLTQPSAQSGTPADSSIAVNETLAPVEPVSIPVTPEPALAPVEPVSAPAVQSQAQ